MAEKEQGFIEIPIENLIEWDEPNGEGCIVSDKITKEGYKVGYMLREEPTEGNPDSGWRFMAGNEDDEYMDNPDNHHILHSTPSAITTAILSLIFMPKSDLLSYV